ASTGISAVHFSGLVRNPVIWMELRIFAAVHELRWRRAPCRSLVLYHSPSIKRAIRLVTRERARNNSCSLDDLDKSAHRQPCRRLIECSAFLFAAVSRARAYKTAERSCPVWSGCRRRPTATFASRLVGPGHTTFSAPRRR